LQEKYLEIIIDTAKTRAYKGASKRRMNMTDEKNNTGYWNTGDYNTGYYNTGYYNTGYWNTGNRNTGYFNTVTPDKVMVFNGHMTSREEFIAACPVWLFKPSPATWVSESEMSDQEKVDNPTSHTCGGYLRKNDWLAEWAKAYASASPEDVQKVRDLPGFDYDIFQEITGLDLRIAEEPKCVPPPTVTINGIRYVMDVKQ
jgi:Pentapeptide repeats (8 copies)